MKRWFWGGFAVLLFAVDLWAVVTAERRLHGLQAEAPADEAQKVP